MPGVKLLRWIKTTRQTALKADQTGHFSKMTKEARMNLDMLIGLTGLSFLLPKVAAIWGQKESSGYPLAAYFYFGQSIFSIEGCKRTHRTNPWRYPKIMTYTKKRYHTQWRRSQTWGRLNSHGNGIKNNSARHPNRSWKMRIRRPFLRDLRDPIWLVVWNFFLFFHILGIIILID